METTQENADARKSRLIDLLAFSDKRKEPGLDIGICSDCGWRGLLSTCDTEQDGDWEHGFFEVPLCPICKDGGCIDDYDYSREQYIKWVKWNHETNIKPNIGS